MPKKAIDYSKTIIYKLVCKDTTITDLYVGSTTSFVDRKKAHKKKCCNSNGKGYNLKVYQMIRANGDWTNWEMVMVEDFPCETKLQAHQRERYWLETLHATMNTNIPSRTRKEKGEKYYELNKEKIKEQAKKWREENKEIIIEKSKKYCEENKEKRNEQNKKWREANREKLMVYYKEKNKKYYEENKEKVKEAKKKYYEENKEKIKEAKKEQIKNVA